MKTKTSENIGTVLGFAAVIALVGGFYLTPAGSIIISSLPIIVVVSGGLVALLAGLVYVLDGIRTGWTNSGAQEMLEALIAMGSGFAVLGIIASELKEADKSRRR